MWIFDLSSAYTSINSMNNINGTTTRYNLLTDTRKLVHRKKYQTLVTYHEIQASRIQQS